MKRTNVQLDAFVQVRYRTGEVCWCMFDTGSEAYEITFLAFLPYKDILVHQHFGTDQNISATTVSTSELELFYRYSQSPEGTC